MLQSSSWRFVIPRGINKTSTLTLPGVTRMPVTNLLDFYARHDEGSEFLELHSGPCRQDRGSIGRHHAAAAVSVVTRLER